MYIIFRKTIAKGNLFAYSYLKLANVQQEPLAISNKKCIVRGSIYCKSDNRKPFTTASLNGKMGKFEFRRGVSSKIRVNVNSR